VEGIAVLRRLQAFFVLAVCFVSIPAAAQSAFKESGAAAGDEATAPPGQQPAQPPASEPPPTAPPAATTTAAEPESWREGWNTSISGYFRAPIAVGISSRPPPDNMGGPSGTQWSYGPNRTLDASYYSFAYTRLQEQDWAEVFVHEKRKHVEAVVGWMGYWYQSAGFTNPNASWLPGMAYLTLDTDFDAFGFKPNIQLTTGAWWPKFGYFEKYDTYTLGRFRQIGAQAKLTIPFGATTVALVGGFGTGRDGSFSIVAPPLYAANTGLDLVAWANAEIAYKKFVDVNVHYNSMWTADPNLTPQTAIGDRSYAAASLAHLTVLGLDATLTAPHAGRLWFSPSVISVRNGWALANGGTEVMHALGGVGVATNYLAWTGASLDSTGSGTMVNLGISYENSLSAIEGKAPGTVPDLSFSIFQLLADASFDLPATTTIKQTSLKSYKWGLDATLQALTWLGFTARFDSINQDLDHPGYIFDALTARVVFSSHFLSGERIYLQYSRYFYGDKQVLGGLSPWGGPLQTGNNIIQAGTYQFKQPDNDVVKLQADIAF
jgi:hypothetical protein